MAKEHYIDVSELAAPEPLEKIVAAIGKLELGEYLRVRHRREPCLLYPILEEKGFLFTFEQIDISDFEMCIWKRGDAEAGNEATREAVKK